MTHKISIEIMGKKLTNDELKQASRSLSDSLEKMGFDHELICHLDKFRKFRVATHTQELSQRLERGLKPYRLK